MTLLSGGERALTVIALLFSFLDYRPAPFCVLDEVDAALDEANVERFSSYLNRVNKETQFIVVSHRKKTMEAAEVLQDVVDPATGKTAVQKLFDEVAPKYADKNGGYTRVLKTYNRKGDNAPMAIIGLF